MIADVALILPTPHCRWCGGAHYIERCPDVAFAFDPAESRIAERQRHCCMCGAVTTIYTSQRRSICEECIKQKAKERSAEALDRLHQGEAWRNGRSSFRQNQMRIVDGRGEYENGAIILGWQETLNSGHFVSGMLVRYLGREWRIHGKYGERQFIVDVEDTNRVMRPVRNGKNGTGKITMSVKRRDND